MKKILVRAHMSPFDNLDAESVLLEDDRLGMNIGNMLFANSVIRTLMTEDTQIDTLHTGRELTPENVERINAEYDCVVMPFANAFRVSFKWQLKMLTKFIKQLKIPCVIPGVGVSATFLSPLKEKNPFDDEVKAFVKAVLDKSAVIGTRGEETSTYLSRLGFREEKEHRVIGCPSMFWYGDVLPEIKQTHLTPQSSVSVNWKMDLPAEIHAFMERNIPLFDDFQYVPQVTDEIRLMYYGMPLPAGKYKKIPQDYPAVSCHPWYCADKARSFINVRSWMEYLGAKDFSFGSRIHGNIASVISGTPCFIIVSDYRISELARYHHIPHINYQEIKADDTIFSLWEKADMSQIYTGHKERFEIYRTFLEENGLEHIFSHRSGAAYEAGGIRCPYDRRMDELELQPALHPFFSASAQEQVERIALCQREYEALQERYGEVKALEYLMRLYKGEHGVKAILKKLRRR